MSDNKIKDIIQVLDGDVPEYHQEGMGCWLEDRNISDRYVAMEYGWEAAMQRVYYEVINYAKDELSALSIKLTADLTPAALSETEIQDRVLHDMGNPQPKERKQWLREYARRVNAVSVQPAAPQKGVPDWANEICEALEQDKAFAFDPAQNVIHADDGGAPEHAHFYVPKAASDARIAELEAELKVRGKGGAERYWEERWRDADAELATARNEVLEEAGFKAIGILNDILTAKTSVGPMLNILDGDAGRAVQEGIRALKTKEPTNDT